MIYIQNREISLLQVGNEIYVSLTDITKGEEGTDHIRNWMRNRNTVEYLGLWESVNNPHFKGVGFDTFRKEAGLNSFNLTPKKWIEATNAIGIVSKSGNSGGTYAHKDIALEFCTWLSPLFKLLILKEFQRLKEREALEGQWDIRRYISKVNYKLQTEAVKSVLLPISNIPKDKEGIIYAKEADLVYYAMFGITSKEWRLSNPELALKGLNIRDVADSHQLIVLANLESLDSVLIKSGVTDSKKRLQILREQAISQAKALKASTDLQHQFIQSPIAISSEEKKSNFDETLKGLLSVPPPKKDK